MTTPAESIEALEFERKFMIPRSRCEAAVSCLDAFCRRDPSYSAGIVSSIYFDTPRLRLLQEKEDSTLYKTKVRLRWYEDLGAGPIGRSFLEIKSRVGLRRAKRRYPVELEAAQLSTAALTDPRILAALENLDQDPTVATLGLRPVLVVRYQRRRWIDPVTGARISLDRSISVPSTNPRILPHTSFVRLPAVILEIKNSSGAIPPNLHFLRALKAEPCSFSKYFECYRMLTTSQIEAA